MSTSEDSRREHSSTYFVQDRSSEGEFTRVRIQDQLITTALGGVLPEQADPTIFRRVLDVGCGSGGWLIETAKTYPDIQLLIGVDVSNKMLDYARAQAVEQQVSDRVEFHMMDALLMLEFPDNYFDLVNQRLCTSFLRKWDWPKLLQEYQRVARPGGVIRITESETGMNTNSPALTRLLDLTCQAYYQAGHSFTPERDGTISEIAHLLEQHGFVNVQTRPCRAEQQAGTPGARYLAEDMQGLFRTIEPFLRKWTHVPDDYEEIYQQMLNETQQPTFAGSGAMLTVWGQKRTP